MTRNGSSSLPRSRSWLEMAAQSCPGAAECTKSAAQAWPAAAKCSRSAVRACPGATAGAKSAARAHSREVRSFLALEKSCFFVRLLSASTFARLHFAPSSSVLVGRSTWPLEPSRPRCALDQAEPNENEPTRASQAYPETLRKAGPRMPVALQARSASLGCSNWPLEPARPRWGARPDRAERKRTEPLRPSLLGDASLGRTTDACLLSASTFAQLHFAPSGSFLLGRSNWPLEPSRPRCALDRAEPNENEPTWKRQAYPETLRMGGAMDACCTPSPLILAGALGLAARARSPSLGVSTGQSRTKTNRTRQAKLTRRRFAGQDHGCLLHSTQRRTYCAWNARVRTSIYIYTYIFS